MRKKHDLHEITQKETIHLIVSFQMFNLFRQQQIDDEPSMMVSKVHISDSNKHVMIGSVPRLKNTFKLLILNDCSTNKLFLNLIALD